MKHRYFSMAAVVLMLVAGVPGWHWYQNQSLSWANQMDKFTENLFVTPTCLYGVEIDSLSVAQAVFQANENLSDILTQYNVSQASIYEIATLPKDMFDVRKLRANKPYTVIFRPDSQQTAHSFIYHPNPIDYVTLHFGDSVWVERGQNPVDTLSHQLGGVIESSLYQAVVAQGGSPQLVSELAEVYAWVIDFFGLQKGDRFRLIYTTYEVAGQTAGFGEIKAAAFTHQGRERLAFGYDQGEGREYFDECGQSLRKTFLKAPLAYSRISSHFSHSRLHPILKIRRPHHGVDYAAPHGTPVVAVGDGLVQKVSYSGGAGRMVRIRHNSNFETAYLHLAGYGPGIEAGARVRQGQVIGYVGSSGLSTGPHLDFRFYKNGTPIDPLTIDPPSSEPIKPAHEAGYDAHQAHWHARLAQVRTSKAAPVLASTPVH
jgi:murein DD-endopeptidase MepM/ murein hydrolase activator NlpD